MIVVAPLEMLYEEDFALWCERNAGLIRDGRFDGVDSEHLAEEIEAMAKRDRRELMNRVKIILVHLLKWHRL